MYRPTFRSIRVIRADRRQESQRCDQCDRPIDGPAYYPRGRPVCADCWDKSEEAEAERAARRTFEASWKGSR